MSVLLDSNAFLWQIGPENKCKLGDRTKRLLKATSAVHVSPISMVELHIKMMIGKLNAPANLMQAALDAGDVLLSFSPIAADMVADFTELTRHDPFDRMLLAQAKAEGMTLVTADRVLIELGLPFVVDARK